LKVIIGKEAQRGDGERAPRHVLLEGLALREEEISMLQELFLFEM
jgi:hypothetical protein